MINYNYEYKQMEYNNKFRMYRVPIIQNIDNTEYNQQTIQFLRNKYPNGLNKQIN